MNLHADTVQFENRVEIGAVIKALEEWQQEHGRKNPDQNKHVQELIDKLDVMSMNW